MKVSEAIKLLLKMPDHTLEILIDCPHCGHGNQIAKIVECVVLKSVERTKEGK